MARALLRIPTERRLFDSLERACKRALVESGFQIDKIDDSQRGAYLFAYCRILHRSIPVKPRVVERSREFQAQMDSETNLELRLRVESVEEEMRQGLNLNVRLTRQFYDASFNDPLLNDLNVQHFHLGDRAKSPTALCKSFGDNLVFGVVGDETVRLVHLGNHHSFKRMAFEHVMFDNWPHLFEELDGIDAGPPIAPKDRDRIRRGGSMVTAVFNGKVYLPPWSGQTMSRTSIWANDRVNRLIDQVRFGRQWLLEQADRIAAEMAANGRSDMTLPLEVQVEGLTVWLVDLVQGLWMCPTRGELRFAESTTCRSDSTRAGLAGRSA